MLAQLVQQLQQLAAETRAALELQHVVHADREQDRVERLWRQQRNDVAAHSPRTRADHARRLPVDLALEPPRHEARDVADRRALDAPRADARDDRIADREEAQLLAADRKSVV